MALLVTADTAPGPPTPAEGVPPGDGTKRMRDGYLRGALSRRVTQRQVDVLRSATLPTCARSGLTTVELIYAGRAAGWLVVPSLEPRPSPASRVGLIASSVDHVT